MDIKWIGPIGFVSYGRPLKFPDTGGVYVIACDEPSDYIRYVGQGNIRDRMNVHENWHNEPNECLAKVMRTGNVRIYFAEIPDARERNNVEHTLYVHYRKEGHTLCNESEPVGSYVYEIQGPSFDTVASS